MTALQKDIEQIADQPERPVSIECNDSSLNISAMRNQLKTATPLPEPVASTLEKHFPLADYLRSQRYQQVSPRIFVKEGSPEIIRVWIHKGKVQYRNFLIDHDKGSPVNFVSHRIHPSGAIVPNKNGSCRRKAVAAMIQFLIACITDVNMPAGISTSPVFPSRFQPNN